MFSDIFKQLIQNSGLSVYKISKDTGISESLMSQWKSGRQLPKYDSLIVLANYFNVSGDYLLGRTSTQEAHLKKTEISLQKQQLMKNYENLSIEGKDKLVEYSDDLVASNRYQKSNTAIVAARSADNVPVHEIEMSDEKFEWLLSMADEDEQL